MHVAHLVNEFPKISETFILNQLSGLLDSGHETTVLAKRPPETPVEHDILGEWDLLSMVTYCGEPASYRAAARLLAGDIPSLLRHGYSLGQVASWFRHGKQTPRLLGQLHGLSVAARGSDVCHVHFGTMAADSLPVLRAVDVPSVVSFYGYDVSEVPRSNPAVYEGVFSEATALTYLSDDMRSDLLDLGAPAAKLHEVPLCVDVEKFTAPKRTLDPDEPVTVLTVARHVEKKGLQYAIEAVANLDTDRRVRYLIAGDGPLREQLERQIADLGAGGSIELLGWQTQEEILQLLTDAHLFLLPSVTAENGDKEGTPTALLEAQASGLPVLSTTHAGIPEIVADGEAGLLVPERDVGALTTALEMLVQSPDRWEQMGSQGQAYVQDYHSIPAVTDALTTVYESAV
jgi:colanic acid/amylovoran biosynthesis glycosyltransferase